MTNEVSSSSAPAVGSSRMTTCGLCPRAYREAGAGHRPCGCGEENEEVENHRLGGQCYGPGSSVTNGVKVCYEILKVVVVQVLAE